MRHLGGEPVGPASHREAESKRQHTLTEILGSYSSNPDNRKLDMEERRRPLEGGRATLRLLPPMTEAANKTVGACREVGME